MGYCYGEWILVVSFVLFRSVFLYLQTLFVSLCSLLYVHTSTSPSTSPSPFLSVVLPDVTLLYLTGTLKRLSECFTSHLACNRQLGGSIIEMFRYTFSGEVNLPMRCYPRSLAVLCRRSSHESPEIRALLW